MFGKRQNVKEFLKLARSEFIEANFGRSDADGDLKPKKMHFGSRLVFIPFW